MQYMDRWKDAWMNTVNELRDEEINRWGNGQECQLREWRAWGLFGQCPTILEPTDIPCRKTYFLSFFLSFSLSLFTYCTLYINTCMHACIHAYMQTCIHEYMHACMHACIQGPANYISSLYAMNFTYSTQVQPSSTVQYLKLQSSTIPPYKTQYSCQKVQYYFRRSIPLNKCKQSHPNDTVFFGKQRYMKEMQSFSKHIYIYSVSSSNMQYSFQHLQDSFAKKGNLQANYITIVFFAMFLYNWVMFL